MRRYPSVAPWRVARQGQDACLCNECIAARPERALIVEQERRAIKAITDRNLRLREDGEYYRQGNAMRRNKG
jgi:hypothetical protein